MPTLNEEINRMKAMAEYGRKPKRETYWVTTQKPKVLNALAQIDAPPEWKKMVITAEKLAVSAQNLLFSGKVSTQRIYELYGDKWTPLMEKIGNPEVDLHFEQNPNYPYWQQYTKLMGYSNGFDFGDCLA